jgi:hypothetical protein
MGDFRKDYLYWFHYFLKGYDRYTASYMAYKKAAFLNRRIRVVVPCSYDP